MGEVRPESYGEAFADVYDDWYADVSDAAATVERLAGLDGVDRVLELGVGTGRLAIPLAATGRTVIGLDASPSMLERLERNDPSGSVVPLLAPMEHFELDEPVDAAFVAFNTFFNLRGATEQRSCLDCVVRHLRPGGHVLIEAIVPDLGSDALDRGLTTRHLPDGGVVMNATVNHVTEQRMAGQQIHIQADGTVRLRPWHVHYLSPSQLDEMAQAAGLELVDRTQDWPGTPFTEASVRHVSHYRRSRPDAAEQIA